MTEKQVVVRRLDLPGAIACLKEAQIVAEHASVIVVDFGGCEWAEPLGMLVFGASLRDLRAETKKIRPEVKFRAIGYEGRGYLAHMGLFKLFGLNYGKAPDEAEGGSRYEPIRFIDLAELERNAAEQYQDTHEYIEKTCQGMASLLVQGGSEILSETLGYCLREIVRNVLEHAQVSGLWYCGQYWPQKDKVELGLFDLGMGVRRALSRNPHIAVESDQDAIRLAIKPGISGVVFQGARQMRNDGWQNSGFGLYMTSQIAAQYGQFRLGSGDSLMTFDAKGQEFQEFRLKGTAVSISLRPSKVTKLAERLSELRKAAKSGSSGDDGTTVRSASAYGRGKT